MKLIVDINDNEYMRIKEYPNNITSYPVTIHIYDAVRNGIPLNDIRAEFINSYPTNYMGEPELNGMTCHFSLNKVLEIIDRICKAESEDENKE